MRVLHVLPTRASSFGGPVRVAAALANSLHTAGHEAVVLPTNARPPLNLGRTRVYWPGIREVGLLRAEVRKADLIHVHTLWNPFCTIVCHMARRAVRPYVVTPHAALTTWALSQSPTKKALYWRVWERRNLTAAKALHFLNDSERFESQAVVGGCPSFVVPNGVPLEQFRNLPGAFALQRVLPRTAGRFVLLYLGRLHHKKGLDLLLRGLSRALQTCPDLFLIIAGPDEGGFLDRVEDMIRGLQLAGAVELVGEVRGDRKRMLLGGAAAFVLPSRDEGDSIALKEALAAGLPCLITPECRMPDVASTGAGLEVPATVEDVAGGLIALHSADLAEMTRQAHHLADMQCSQRDMGRRMLQAYEAVLSGFDPAAAVDAHRPEVGVQGAGD